MKSLRAFLQRHEPVDGWRLEIGAWSLVLVIGGVVGFVILQVVRLMR